MHGMGVGNEVGGAAEKFLGRVGRERLTEKCKWWTGGLGKGATGVG